MDDGRKSYRIKYETPICTKISIVNVNGKAVITGTGHICVEDIGPGGLKFLSGLDFPVTENVIIQFGWEIEESVTEFYGCIVRKEHYKNGIYRYGVKFINDMSENEVIIKELNELIETGALSEHGLCNGNFDACLKRHKFKNNRRAYRRFKLNDEFMVKMDIFIGDDGKDNMYSEYVAINNISEGGMQFATTMELPEVNDKAFMLKIYLDDSEICIYGYITRREKNADTYNYAIKFDNYYLDRKEIYGFIKDLLDFSVEKGIYKQKYFIIKYSQKISEYEKPEDENHEWWV